MINDPPKYRESEHTHTFMFERLFRDDNGIPIAINVSCGCGERKKYNLVEK